jgi:hypothetical protein
LDFLEHPESGYRFSGCSNNQPKRDSNRALVLAVLLGVVPARLYVMTLGVAGMAVGGVRMMRGLLMIAGLVMLGGLDASPHAHGARPPSGDAPRPYARSHFSPGLMVKSPKTLTQLACTQFA